jgi:hypothetical protein
VTDYQPVYLPGDAMTETASAAVTGRQLLEVTGNGTVGPVTPAGLPSAKVVGIAAGDAVINARVTFYARATVHESPAFGTITAGDQVGAGITGDTADGVRTVPAPALSGTPSGADINAELARARAILGVALTTAAAPALCRWMSY